MSKPTATDLKFNRMTKEPVDKLVCTFAIPTIVTMLITSIYNMADTYFVSKISTSASGAVGISFSLMSIIQAIGFTFGTGAGNYISRLLGSKDEEYAAKVAATGFFTAFGLGALLAIIGLVFINPLVYALGATNTIAPYAKAYIRYILIGMPFMTVAFVLNQVLRYQGSAYYSMIGIGIGGLINIILDPIFITTFNMGIAGAALATIISQFISFILLFRSTGKNGNIEIKLKNFSPSWEIYKDILQNGLPSFYRQALSSTAIICLNFAAGFYGDAAIAGISIAARVVQFAVSIVFGFGQGFQPVCGFNYGAKEYDRVLKAFWFTVKVVLIFFLAVSVTGYFFASRIIAIFRKEDMDVIIIGAKVLKYQCFTLPLLSWIIPSTMLLQTIGESAKASFVSISRQGLFFIPVILILPRWLGLLGAQISQPIADVFSFAAAICITPIVLKELKGVKSTKVTS